MGIYKRKPERQKERKHAFDQEKSKIRHKKKENALTKKKKSKKYQGLDYAFDQEKKQVLRSYFFSFINSNFFCYDYIVHSKSERSDRGAQRASYHTCGRRISVICRGCILGRAQSVRWARRPGRNSRQLCPSPSRWLSGTGCSKNMVISPFKH